MLNERGQCCSPGLRFKWISKTSLSNTMESPLTQLKNIYIVTRIRGTLGTSLTPNLFFSSVTWTQNPENINWFFFFKIWLKCQFNCSCFPSRWLTRLGNNLNLFFVDLGSVPHVNPYPWYCSRPEPKQFFCHLDLRTFSMMTQLWT